MKITTAEGNQLRLDDSGLRRLAPRIINWTIYLAIVLGLLYYSALQDKATDGLASLLLLVGGVFIVSWAIIISLTKNTSTVLLRDGLSSISTKRLLSTRPEIKNFSASEVSEVRITIKKGYLPEFLLPNNEITIHQYDTVGGRGGRRYKSKLYLLIGGELYKLGSTSNRDARSAKIDIDRLYAEHSPLLKEAGAVANFLNVPLKVEAASIIPKPFRKFLRVE